MTTTQSFLGIPVDGDIIRADTKVPQRPIEDLAPMLQAVLDDGGIAQFGWTQYTPYFNDGDPCIFGVHSLWVARHEDVPAESLPADDEASFDKEDLDVSYGSRLGSYEGGQWVDDPEDPNRRMRVGAHYEGPDEARYIRCKALSDAIDSGAFDEVLLAAFGDHAEVTVKRDGIAVEFYEHD